VSGTQWTALTEEIVSGSVAVCLSQSGNIRIAMASVSGRMPAVGVVFQNTLSGLPANVYTAGAFQFTSGLVDFSGYLGQSLFVGRSGQIVTTSGSFNSGGLLSGDVIQPIGYALNSGGGMMGIAASLPFVASLVLSGNIASGQIGSTHIATGSVQGSIGTIDNIASGTIGTFDIGSGQILSGNIASGQVGTNHISSGAVTSGNIASGQVGSFHIGSGAIVSGRIASGQIGSTHIATGSVQGSIGTFDNIASGTIGSLDIGSGQILSGNIASGQVGTNHISSGAVTSGNIASGQVGSFHIGSGAVTSGRLGTTGTPTGGSFLRDDFTWAAPPTGLSGVVGSGSISSGMFASGLNYQGYPMSQRQVVRLTAFGTISGGRAVCVDNTGNARIAQSTLSGLMPALGYYDGPGVLSGQVVEFVVNGIVTPASGLNLIRPGRPVWVNASGFVGNISGGFLSGGFGGVANISGAVCQCLGIATHSGQFYVEPGYPCTSGLPLLNAGTFM
jgi:hypothetical protein